MPLTRADLVNAVGDASDAAGITIRAQLEPLGGPHERVKPAGYAGGQYQDDERWFGDPPVRTKAIVIDNVPSQANRLEAALRRLRGELGLPEIVLDLSSVDTLPPHLPRSVSSFLMPHRQADAYLRDSLLDGKTFSKTALGAELLNASADNPAALLAWFPQALIFGFWHSHLGKKRSQAKLSRAWVSEIVGYDPATEADTRTRGLGVKGDPINLSVDEAALFDEADLVGAAWFLDEGSKKEKAAPGKSRKALSEIGHGQVPFKASDAALAPVSFRAIEQRATISFAALRRLSLHDAEASATMRALLVALALVAHVDAFGRAFHLRSGCDLRAAGTQWTFLEGAQDEDTEPLSREAAVALFQECRSAAEQMGLLSSGGWGKDPVIVTPAPGLSGAIAKTWPLAPIGV